MPKVTVIIPAFNAEAYIGETLASVREQTLRDIEVLLIDDGSSDGTLREAERFVGTMDLKIIEQANAGPAAARNVGIKRAASAYCAFIDCDDLMLPERLAAQAAALDADPDLGLAFTDLMTFNESGIVHRTRRAFSDPCGGMVLERLLMDNFITTSTVMAPRQRLIEAGLFDESSRLSEDFDLWLRIARRWPIAYVDQPLVKYRHRPGSLSEDKFVTGLSALQVVEKFWNENPEYAREVPTLQRRSLARHLTFTGSAALARSRGLAIPYLLRSLRRDPANAGTWKWLAKALIWPRQPQRRAVKTASASEITA